MSGGACIQIFPQVSEFLSSHVEAGKVKLTNYKIVWGDNTLTRVEMMAIQHLLQLASDWKYVINLSGSDYPLRPVKSIYDWLAKNGKGGLQPCSSCTAIHLEV